FKNGPMGIGQVIVSVKGGDNLGPDMVRSLLGTVERDSAQLGLLVCLADPTKKMREEAAAAGIVTTAHGRFPRIQVVTIENLLKGIKAQMPPPLETEAFRLPVKSSRPSSPSGSPQLALPLTIKGGKRGKDIEEHL